MFHPGVLNMNEPRSCSAAPNYQRLHEVHSCCLYVFESRFWEVSQAAALQAMNAVLCLSLNFLHDPYINSDGGTAAKLQYGTVLLFTLGGMIYRGKGDNEIKAAMEPVLLLGLLVVAMHSFYRCVVVTRDVVLTRRIKKTIRDKLMPEKPGSDPSRANSDPDRARSSSGGLQGSFESTRFTFAEFAEKSIKQLKAQRAPVINLPSGILHSLPKRTLLSFVDNAAPDVIQELVRPWTTLVSSHYWIFCATT